ncbi:short-chain collagen C4-like [Mytilus trossulus]|uniref:short-chain collagen C4-like n=1 Tax=Mytilus trossulus TaxID=6551 RepID=UPI00300686AB
MMFDCKQLFEWIVWACFLTGTVSGVKRLLLNDPDIVSTLQHMTLELQKLRAEVSRLTQKTTLLENSKLAGSAYTRWGRKDCPVNGTELVYTGIIGGGYYAHKGAPANTICLPHDPDFIHGDKIQFPAEVSTMYGGEYQDNYFGHSLYQNDPPCAVCRATGKTSVIMIPGKTKCYGDWHLEYNGRLAAGRDSYEASSEYICVDHQAQYREGGGTNQDGKLLYAVVAKCGTLPCPPYFDNAPIACVVCSR